MKHSFNLKLLEEKVTAYYLEEVYVRKFKYFKNMQIDYFLSSIQNLEIVQS